MEYNFNVKEQTEKVIEWTRNWFAKNGNEFTKAVIGISGGKDSTVVAKLLCEALGKDRVVGVMMPNGEQKDISDSIRVCDILGIENYTINIGSAYEALTKEMRQVSENGKTFPTDMYKTNTPARLRMTTLYGVGATIGNCRVVNTGNLSEGINFYYTLYGDHAGDMAPIELFTTEEVMAIGDYLGIPYDLVHKKPSDGMSFTDAGVLLSDEEKLGYTYAECNKLIRYSEKGENFEKIMKHHSTNVFKDYLVHFPHYDPNLPNYFL